jgi:hemoglobin
MATLYEKLGGKEAVDIAVDKFYDRVINDERIKHFFANTDMKAQKQHQKDFMTYAFGGVERFKGRDMRDLIQN